MKKFKLYSDPGHAWLAVKIDLIKEMNLLDKISSYSYVRGRTLYLEEDLDAQVFMKAYSICYGEFEVYKSYSDKSSPIRSYMNLTPQVRVTL